MKPRHSLPDVFKKRLTLAKSRRCANGLREAASVEPISMVYT